jgi:4a-hydroxytetrahydrobiopterin dehydratase
MAVLDEFIVNEKLKKINGWKFVNNQIEKDFKLKDFKSALYVINKIGDEAEKLNHHPDILLHSYNKLKVTISTHSEGGVTDKDFYLAQKIEGLKVE